MQTTMVKCTRTDCDNGQVTFQEGPHYGQETCYHCGGTGQISEEAAREDRFQAKLEQVAHQLMQRERDAVNSNEEGEGWAFHAAENGCTEYEYSWGVVHGYIAHLDRLVQSEHIARQLIELMPD